jgi:hypothetical protein
MMSRMAVSRLDGRQLFPRFPIGSGARRKSGKLTPVKARSGDCAVIGFGLSTSTRRTMKTSSADSASRLALSGTTRRRRLIGLQVAALFPALLVVGCLQRQPPHGQTDSIVLQWNQSTEPPLVENRPPDSIIIQWRQARATLDDVKDIADWHCQASDLHAVQVSATVDGDKQTSVFVCK